MTDTPAGPGPSSPKRTFARWLLGGGALLTLLGGVTAEISVLLLFTGLPVAWLAQAVFAGIGLVTAGVTLLIMGKRMRR